MGYKATLVVCVIMLGISCTHWQTLKGWGDSLLPNTPSVPTTTTIPPTPTPTNKPTPAIDYSGNYDPAGCNPTYQWPAVNFAYWETVDNGAKGVSGMELPSKATWHLADGQRVDSAQGGGWFYLPTADSRTIAGPITLEITGRSGVYKYVITDPRQTKNGIEPQ